MTYQEAIENLRIAEKAYNAGAYSESADIVRKIAYYAISRENGLTAEQRDEVTEAVKRAISSFTYCPDEAVWEDVCGLGDLF